jgi:hypothetical protein
VFEATAEPPQLQDTSYDEVAREVYVTIVFRPKPAVPMDVYATHVDHSVQVFAQFIKNLVQQPH